MTNYSAGSTKRIEIGSKVIMPENQKWHFYQRRYNQIEKKPENQFFDKEKGQQYFRC